MKNERMAWQDGAIAVAEADVNTRAAFISRTYTHVFGALAGFTLLEIALYQSGMMESITRTIMSWGHFGWLGVLGAFMIVGALASRTAMRAVTPQAQYTALVGYVAVQALIFCPLLYIAAQVAPDAIATAAVVTLLGFAALTGIAFYTRKDFSFLRGVVMWGGVGAIGMIVAGTIMGFTLGIFFSVGMVIYAGAMILYDTSNVMHHYPEDRHVAASLQLFAAVALMFWYVLRICIHLAAASSD